MRQLKSSISGLLQVVCSGVFELRLKSFINENGKDSLGQCCSGERNGRCVGPCRTRFRVCLKHYQQKIDPLSACTFGDVMTPVLGENNVHLNQTGALDIPGFTNPIRFPFDFSWPVSFFSFQICIPRSIGARVRRSVRGVLAARWFGNDATR